MFREMRRNKQLLSSDECNSILINGTSGVLALHGDNGYPYAVPLSYVYNNGKIYFHSAKCGHKVDAIIRCNKASFCIIECDNVIPDKYTTAYRSVIAFGRISIPGMEKQKEAAIMLAEKYRPLGSRQSHTAEIEKSIDKMYIFEFEIEHLSGKESIEFLR